MSCENVVCCGGGKVGEGGKQVLFFNLLLVCIPKEQKC